jgi:hypothetical protein
MFLGRGFFRKRPWQHEFRFKDRAGALDDAVKRRSHPADHRVANPALDISDELPGRALVPLPIEALSREPELHKQVLRIIWRLRLAPLFSPEPEERRLIPAHNDPRV